MGKAAFGVITAAILVLLFGYWFVMRSETAVQPPPERNDVTLRTTTTGDVVGFVDRFGARAWLGLPYAQPPVGDLRWRAPQPPRREAGLREALLAGNACPQKPSLLTTDTEAAVTGSEDCLTLNIWSPPNAVNLPVMFWIHGGGNTIGHGAGYNGAYLATERKVVVVTINYRLGLFGWFRHPALARGDALDDSGNYGTLDMIAALNWVRDNIGQFGGDAGNVTVFGESAGAKDTLSMMASPLAKGLFHKAIVQSGGYRPYTLTQATSYLEDGGHPASGPEIVNRLLVQDGKVSDRAAARAIQDDMPAGDVRAYLYQQTPESLYRLFPNGGFGMIDTPDVFADGRVLPKQLAEDVFASPETHNMVPVILGTNRDEPALFMTRDPRWVSSWFGVFNRFKDEAAYLRQVRYQALAWKARGVDELAQYMVRAGNPSVFAYRFDWDEEPTLMGFDLAKALGAAHAIEIGFVFGDFEGGLGIGYVYPGNAGQWALSTSMMSYWSQMAYAGDPDRGRDGENPDWTPWGSDGNTFILLDSPTGDGIRMTDTVVTAATVKAELAADTSFTDQRDRCELYVRMFGWDGNFDADEYAHLGGDGCSQWDPKAFSGF
ncbi:MAG: carboxylesterase family protein [Pseudomonadales bacterium]|nr:carboxylesterase family protein [Pseudomonadales bacterium]MCP5185084.1 carboxylesterase family protein [Pseudomonadales bacterium]